MAGAPIRVPLLPNLGPLTGAEKVVGVQDQGGVPVVGLIPVDDLGAGSRSVIELAFMFTSAPDANEVVGFCMLTTAVTFFAGFPGALGMVQAPPVATYVQSIRSGGTPLDPASGALIGTITTSPAGVVTFATAGGVDVVAPPGLLKLVTPDPMDVGISGFAATVRGMASWL
jgi:hypothetical protein